MSQAVEALNSILEKYHVEADLGEFDKQRLVTRALAILENRMYATGSEGRNLIDASDKMLHEVDQTLFMREEEKAA
jgi:hypothetical protein